MSPYRIADAARISPYPRTNPALEQERSPDATSSANSASAPTGLGGGSPSKARLMAEAAAAAANSASNRSTRTVERSVTGNGRQGQTEERFNVGAPKNPKNFLRRNWRGRSSRSILEGIDEGVPNYPPPTFQEAMGIPFAPSLSTLAHSSSSISAVPETDSSPPPTAGENHDQSESETSIGRVSPIETPSASESEDSLEIISPQPRDQRIEFPPCLSPSLQSLSNSDASISPSSDSLLTRGRAKSKMASVLDLNDSDENIDHGHELEPGLVRTSTKKRFLSLSPLRTLFPPKQHQALQTRALSAHPPGTSPYSAARSAHFFRSTTSLASSSVLRFPSFGASTLTLTANHNKRTDDVESVSGKSNRKFLPSMNREKEKQRFNEDEVSDDESLESWEVLGRDGEVESRRIEYEPRSLMAMIVPTADPSSSIVMSSEVSPTRSLSFTYGAPPTPTALSSIDPSLNSASTCPLNSPMQTASSWTEPHPLSLRDRKVQEAIQPFLSRRPKRDGGSHHKPKTAPSTIIVSPPALPGTGPLVTRVRTRMNQVLNSNQNDQQQTVTSTAANSVDIVAPRSEEHHMKINIVEKGTVMIDTNTHELQKALDTPLPSSPIHSPSPFTPSNASILPPVSSVSSSPSSVIISISSPTTPVPARGGVVLGGDGEGEVGVQQISPVPTPKVAEMLDTRIQKPETVDYVCKHHSTPHKITSAGNSSLRHSSSPATPTPAHPKQYFDTTLVMSSTPQASHRRHYQGRPLPQPPSHTSQPTSSRNAVVDSVYAGHGAYPSTGSPNTTVVPEGLLIDLEHDDDPDMSGTWTPPFEDRSHQMNIASAPMTPQRASPIDSLTNSPIHSVRSLPPSASANASSLSGLSEMTDLEILAATLGEENHSDGGNGRDADYETLLLISEFLGPADTARVNNVNMGTGTNTSEPNVSLTGCVEVQRRRVTADGRVKLKMSMFGVPVSQCGICLSQFRGGQHGSMSLSCRHIFHENCLRQWLVRSKTCPLCRISLDSGNR